MDTPVNIRRIMERYQDPIWRLKCGVMTGRISGCVYQETVAAMRYEVIREGLRERDFEDVSTTLSAPLTIISHKCLWLRLIRQPSPRVYKFN